MLLTKEKKMCDPSSPARSSARGLEGMLGAPTDLHLITVKLRYMRHQIYHSLGKKTRKPEMSCYVNIYNKANQDGGWCLH